MDVVVIFNGLGNQMSQYAFYEQKKSIDKSTQNILFCNDHNGAELTKVFGINFKQNLSNKIVYIIFRILLTDKVILAPLKWLLKLLGCCIIYENFVYYFKQEYLLPSRGIKYYFGGWPSEKYFLPIKLKLYKKFEFTKPVDTENTEHLHNINKSNSVAIHIRRGDYLNQDNINLFGKVCNKEYYQAAIALMQSKVDDPHFFVFSNDIEWVKQNIEMPKATFVTCNTKENSWKDMYLMSVCKHNIIANSSFSWWGAWLNKSLEKIVISPSRYLNDDKITDFYPESWIRLSDY